MRILIFHGYLLHGTGSNVYNAELGAALVRAGHELHLLCQDRVAALAGLGRCRGELGLGPLVVEERRSPVRATVYRPDIGGVLPLYVADRYEGFDARPFHGPERRRGRALRRGQRGGRARGGRARAADVALANHLVMGPAILARARPAVPYAVKIHGSALEYTVKPVPALQAPSRSRAWRAPAACSSAPATRRRACGGRWTTRRWRRTRLGPPGVDVERSAPRAPPGAARR